MVFEPQMCRLFQKEVHIVQHLCVTRVVKSSNAFKMLDLAVDVLVHLSVEGPRSSGQHRQVRWCRCGCET